MTIFPWLKTRKLLLFLSSLEYLVVFLISILIDLLLNRDLSTLDLNRQLLNIIFSSEWCFFSYLLGRYDIKGSIILSKKTKTIFREVFLTNLLTYLGMLLAKNILNYHINNYLILKLIFIGFISLLIQIISTKKYNQYRKSKKHIVWHIGNPEIIDKIFFYIDNIENEIQYEIIPFPNSHEKFPDEIIISSSSVIYKFENELKKVIKNRIPILTITQWCELNLNLIPTEFVTEIQSYSKIYSNYKLIGVRRLKRIGDLFVSFTLILFAMPFLILSAIIIKSYDKGPIFYKQKRTGLWGEEIIIYKLRTMINNAELNGVKWSIKNDTRITPFGKILRKTRFDEIPQLFSVIKGEMSLIGPRPERPEFDREFIQSIVNYKTRYWLKPGLSGWAQVNYPYGASKKDTVVKLSYDLFYFNNLSFFLDLLILFKTIFLVINAKGSEPNK